MDAVLQPRAVSADKHEPQAMVKRLAADTPRATEGCDTEEEGKEEAAAALHEAYMWDWPHPPELRLCKWWQTRHTSKPIPENSLQLKLDMSSWETPIELPYRRRDSDSSHFDDGPRGNSSTLSSELGPLTPEDPSDDPFFERTPMPAPPPKRVVERPSRRYGVPF